MHEMRYELRGAAVLITALQLVGCYAYGQVEPASVRAGETVRVTITSEEALRQEDVLAGLRSTLEGQVVESDASGSLGLTLPRPGASPAERTAFNTFVAVPWSSVTRVEEKRLSKGRTILLAAAGAAAAVGILALATGGTGGEEPPPSNSLVGLPLLRVLLGR
jgi:hypothetical protein